MSRHWCSLNISAFCFGSEAICEDLVFAPKPSFFTMDSETKCEEPVVRSNPKRFALESEAKCEEPDFRRITQLVEANLKMTLCNKRTALKEMHQFRRGCEPFLNTVDPKLCLKIAP